MNKFYTIVLLTIITASPIRVIAQKGPGGVSHETTSPRNSDCKVWLDASSIVPDFPFTYPLEDWEEEYQPNTLSEFDNSVSQSTSSLQPIFSSLDVGLGINGKQAFSFEDGRHFLFSTTDDINGQGPYTERTTFIVFRTGSDITTRQMLYEQGGNIRGLNIYIENGDLILGAYDDVKDGDNTPKWGYTYTSEAISANTTYVVTHQFYGEEGNTTNGFIRGYLNGQGFSTDATNVGSLWSHTGSPGLGAVNGNTVIINPDNNGNLNVISDDIPFLGRFAEFIAYDHLLNDAERIIVENYLGAKYSATFSQNDLFAYESTHGEEVIGVGRESVSNTHTLSQGRNLFSIEVDPSNLDTDLEYLFIGNDDGSLSGWNTLNAPEINTQRISREWRASHTGDVGLVTLTIDSDDFPSIPNPDFNKYVVIIDKANGLVSDFTSSDTDVIELVNTSGTYYATDILIPDGAFITIGILQPTVSFFNSVAYGFEGETDISKTLEVKLNYQTASALDVAYDAETEVSATNPADYTLNSSSPLNFTAGTSTTSLSFNIIGDVNTEDTESIKFSLLSGLPTSSELTIGATDTVIYTIYDNDAPPKIGFGDPTSEVHENASNPQGVQVVRSGSTSGTAWVTYRLNTSGGSPTEGTATITDDYLFTADTLFFADGESQKNISFDLVDNTTNEFSETIKFELYDISSGSNLLEGSEIHTLTITDNDPLPAVEFSDVSLEFPEIISNPSITIELSSVTDKDVTVDYLVTGGTATGGGNDYNLATSGTLNILSGSTSVDIPITILYDATEYESDETIIIELTGATNAQVAGNMIHTYTITDYFAFEYTGSAGVGDAIDNVFWLRADQVTGNHGDDVAAWNDFSPNDNDASASGDPSLLSTSQTINGHPAINFDGNDYYDFADDDEINDLEYTNKNIFIVFRTGADITSTQVIYFEGGTTRSLNFYIDNQQLYFVVYNDNDDDSFGAWGVSSNRADTYLVSDMGDLQPNTTYFASFEFNQPQDRLLMRLNGKEFELTSAGLGKLFGHANAALCRASAYMHSGTFSSNDHFTGDIAEIIYYSNDPLSDFRIKLVENYLAAKYNLDFADINDQMYAYKTTHGSDVVGIGKILNSHKDAQGPAQVRIREATDLDEGEYLLIGHDGATLTDNGIDVPEGISFRMNRCWRVSETGELGTLKVSIDISDLPLTHADAASDFAFLIDVDGDFTTGATQITTGLTYSSQTITVADLDLNDGDYFTIGYKGNQWTGEVDNDWNNAGNWTKGIPDASSSIIIPGNPTGGSYPETNSGADIHINNLTINSNANIDIEVGQALQIDGDLMINGELLLKSDQFGAATLFDNGSISGTGTVKIQRYFSKRNYHYFSPPTDDALVSNLNIGRLFYFNETVNHSNTMKGWQRPSGTFQVGLGYAMYPYGNKLHTFESSPSSINTGDITVSVTNSNYGIDSDGWNLIGNPYPSPISAEDFVAANAPGLIDGNLYFWDDSNDLNGIYESTDYLVWNVVGDLGVGEDDIAAHQAFFVKANNSGDIVFNNSMRRVSSPTFFRQMEQKNDLEKIKIAIIDETQKRKVETIVAFKDDASAEHDALYDAKRLSGSVAFSLYSFMKDQQYAIQTLNREANRKDTINLGIEINKTGSFKIYPVQISLHDRIKNICLWDKETDSLHIISKGLAYEFSAEAGKYADRFVLIINADLGTTIKGSVKDINGNPLAGTKIELHGDSLLAANTDFSGNFELTFKSNINPTLQVKNENKGDSKAGISTLDILMMRQHILNRAPLKDELTLQAADVNGSGSVTSLDIALIRQLILGTATELPDNKSWRYFFSSTLKEYAEVQSSDIAYDFVGVKLGDVNNSWNSTNQRLNTDKEINLAVQDIQVVSGSTIKVPVTAENFKQISGYQFTMKWDPNLFRLQRVENEKVSGNFNEQLVGEGYLSTQWDDENLQGYDLQDDAILFYLVFEVMGSNGEESILEFSSDITQTEAYTNGMEQVSVNTSAARMMIGDHSGNLDVSLQNYPNPFSTSTTISFYLQSSSDVKIQVLDQQGRTIDYFEQTFMAGHQEVPWSTSNKVTKAGLYFIKLITNGKQYTTKMVIR